MVARHAAKDVVEHNDGGADVRALVQHNAFGTLAHGGVGDFRTRRLPRLREPVQDLGCPDHREVRRFGQPHDLFLDLGEAFVPGFDGEVAAGDHDTDERGSHGVQEDLGEVSEGGSRLDLQDESEMFGVQAVQVGEQFVDVVFIAQERRAIMSA